MQGFNAELLLAERVDTHVLISAQRGVDTEEIARQIHSGGRRRSGPFIVLHCCGLSDEELESALFGRMPEFGSRHIAGSLVEASGGSLLIDGIGELSCRLQEQLLRFLEQPRSLMREASRVGDVRIFAATTENLYARVVEGTFLEALFYRINVIHLAVPPQVLDGLSLDTDATTESDDLQSVVAHSPASD